MSLSSTASAHERFTCWQPRFELCAVCKRPARGFGWQEPQRAKHPRPPAWFCSFACQTLFWERTRRFLAMVDLTQEEQSAMRHAMKMVAEIMEEIGWNTRLIDLTEPQVLTIIEVAIGGFQDAMREIASASKTQVPEVPF
jgi:hypothetical protein